MIKIPLIILILLLPWLSHAQEFIKKGEKLVGVFDGRTPCQELSNQINEKTNSACIKIKWRLALYQDSITGTPTRYLLWGLAYKKQNPREGSWLILKGSDANPHATIYQLNESGRQPLLLLKADDNVLFFLDKEKRILVGNRDFSYTLNRVNKNL